MDQRILFVLVVHLLGAHLINADGHGSCFDDVDKCTEHLRTLLTDYDAFWFGKDFLTRCPPGTVTLGCFNSDTDNWSILSRLYNTSNDARIAQYTPAIKQVVLADVTFPPKKGSYYGCGHTFYERGTEHRLDPMKVTTVNSWTLDQVPTVTWDRDDVDSNTWETVVMWDVGSYYLHGLYINARGGKFETATALDKYHGPINPRTSPNIYLFAVFRQTGYINPGTAAGMMGRVMGMNEGRMAMSQFLAMMAGSITDMVAANVLSVPGDAYSMERQKNFYIANTCPYLITQSQALKDILQAANVMASWTQERQTLDFTPTSHLATLTVDIAVEYSMPKDIVVDSCCVKTTYTQSMYRPDPLGTQPTTPSKTSNKPRINLFPIAILTDMYDSIRNKMYTLMMVDMSDPSNLIVHWMVSNIKDGDVNKGDEILPYLGPNPFKRDDPRVYVFLLLNQKVDTLDTQSLASYTSNSCPDFIRNRCGAQLGKMLQDWDLSEIVGVTWFQAVQDAFARKRLYAELKVKMMYDVCEGQPGFEDPCPQEQYCKASSGHALTTGLLSSVICALTASYYLMF